MFDIQLSKTEADWLRRHVSNHCLAMGARRFAELYAILGRLTEGNVDSSGNVALRLSEPERLTLQRNLYCTNLAYNGRAAAELGQILKKISLDAMPRLPPIEVDAAAFDKLNEILERTPAPNKALADLMRSTPPWQQGCS